MVVVPVAVDSDKRSPRLTNLERPDTPAGPAAKSLDDISVANNVVTLPVSDTAVSLPVEVAHRTTSSDSTQMGSAYRQALPRESQPIVAENCMCNLFQVSP